MLKTVEPLKKEDINEASVVVARAFENDEFLRYIFEGKKEYMKKLVRGFEVAVKFGWRYGQVWVTQDLKGVSICFPPNQFRRPIWRWIRSGAIGMLMRVGLDFMSRENPVTDFRDDIRLKYMKDPHWYLYIIAVDPDYQGKGYASLLFRTMFEKIGNTPIFLDTNTEKDVSLFEHLGFKILEKAVLPTPPRENIFNWSMVK